MPTARDRRSIAAQPLRLEIGDSHPRSAHYHTAITVSQFFCAHSYRLTHVLDSPFSSASKDSSRWQNSPCSP